MPDGPPLLPEDLQRLVGTLFNAVSDAIFVVDPIAMIVVYANESAARVLGYSIEALTGKSVFDLHPPGDADRIRERMQSIARDPRRSETVFRFQHADGHVLHLHGEGFSVASGSRPLFCGVFRPLESWQADVEGARRKESRYCAIIEQTDVPIFVQREGVFVEVNPAACEHLQYTRDQLIGMRISDISAVRTPVEISVLIDRIREMGTLVFETVHRRSDNLFVPVEVRSKWTTEGEIISFVRDLTAQKSAEHRALGEKKCTERLLWLRDQHIEFSSMRRRLAREMLEFTEASRVYRFVASDDGTEFRFLSWVDSNDVESTAGHSISPISRQNELVQKVMREGIVYIADTNQIATWLPQLDLKVDLLIVLDIPNTEPKTLNFFTNPACSSSREHLEQLYKFADGLVSLREKSYTDYLLRESERRYATLLSNLEGMAFRCRFEPARTMEFASLGAKALTGYSSEELLARDGVTYRSLIALEDADRVWSDILDAVQVGESFAVFYRITNREGRIRWVWEKGNVIRKEGVPTWIEGFVTDYTDQKDAQNELERSEQRFRSIIEKMSFAAAIQIDQRIIYANDSMVKLFGEKSPRDLVGESSFRWLDEGSQRKSIDIRERIARGERGSSLWEGSVVRADGSKCPFVANLFPVQMRDGLMMVVIAQDISAQKIAEQELVRSEQRFRMIVEKTAFTAAIARNGVIEYANEACATMFGEASPSQLVGQYVGRWFDEETLAFGQRMIAKRTPGEIGSDLWAGNVVRADGTRRSFLANSVTMELRDGPVTMILAHDTTAQKAAEEELVRSEQRFRAIVEQTTFGSALVVNDRVIYANDALARMFGFEKGTDITRFDPIDWADDDTKRMMEERRRLRQQGATLRPDFEGSGFRRTGERLYFHVNVFPTQLREGPAITIFVRDVTAQKQAEDELARSEQRFRAIVERTTFGTALLRDERVIYANQALAQMYGLRSADEVLGTNFADWMDSDTKQRLLMRRELRRRNMPIDPVFEGTAIRVNGERMHYQSNSFPIELRDGPALTVFIRDVTAQKEAEEELLRSEQRFRAIIEQTGFGTAIVRDKPTGIVVVYANQALADFFETTPEELIGTDPVPLFDEPSQQLVKARRAVRDAGGQNPPDWQVSFYRPNGEHRYLGIRTFPLVLRDGPAMVLFVQDITEQKRSQEEVLASEQRFRTIIEHSGYGTALIRGEDVIYANDSLARMHGFQKGSDLEGRKFVQQMDADTQRTLNERVELRRRGIPMAGDIEGTILRDDGTRIHFHASTFPIILRDGPAVAVFVRDSTAQKEAEEELVRSEQRFRTIIEQTGFGTALIREIDGVGITIYANQSLATLVGARAEDLIGTDLIARLDDQTIELVRRRRVDRLAGITTSPEWEASFYLPNGDHRFLKIYAFPVILRDGPVMVLFASDITESKRAQDELVRSEQRFRAIIEQTWFATFMERDGRIIYSNPGLGALLGVADHRALIGRDIAEWHEPESREELLKRRAIFERGEETSRVWTGAIRRESGERIYFLANTFHLQLRDGPARVVFAVDITQQREAEEEVLRSEQRFRAIVEQTSFGTALVRDTPDDTVTLYVNQAIADMIGEPTTADVVKTGLLARFDEPTRAIAHARRALRDSGACPPSTWRGAFVRSTGEHRFFSANSFPIELRDGRAMVVFIQDITDRKATEDQRRLLEMAVESANETIVITDKDGAIEYANEAFLTAVDRVKNSVIGTSIELYERLEPHSHDARNEAIEKHGRWLGNTFITRGEEQSFEEQAMVTALCREDGSIEHLVRVGRDVSEYLRLERELEQARKMEALGTLAGGIAHDFNNILAGILGFADLTLLETLTEKVENYMQSIVKSTLRARELVQQILLYSRKQMSANKPVDLVACLLEANGVLATSLRGPIQFEIAHDEAWILGNATQIHQVILNLATNADYAMQGRQGAVRVRLLSQDADWLIEVIDVGEGIDKSVMDRIFDPFFTTKPQGKGTGLGLSVVAGIVRNHKGHITVDSARGTGTTFRIRFPRVDRPVRASLNPAKIDHKSDAASATILLVDDEEALLAVVGTMLKNEGFNVREFKNPLEALESVHKGLHFELAIVDWAMPQLSGLNLAMALHRRHPHVPIILSTGSLLEPDSSMLLEAGILLILSKPYERAELTRAVRSMLATPPKVPQ